jgi:hypothetical protein
MLKLLGWRGGQQYRINYVLVLFGFLLNITNSLSYLLKSVLVVGVGDLKI